MKRLFIVIAMFLVLAAGGCNEKPAAKAKPLVPTPKERNLLRLHKLDPATPAGQAKLRKIRSNYERLEKSKARVRGWVEQAEKKKQEEAERAKQNRP